MNGGRIKEKVQFAKELKIFEVLITHHMWDQKDVEEELNFQKT